MTSRFSPAEVQEILGQLIDNDQAAELIGCTPRTMRAWVSLRQVPFYKVGRSVRFRRQELLDWLEERHFSPKKRHET